MVVRRNARWCLALAFWMLVVGCGGPVAPPIPEPVEGSNLVARLVSGVPLAGVDVVLAFDADALAFVGLTGPASVVAASAHQSGQVRVAAVSSQDVVGVVVEVVFERRGSLDGDVVLAEAFGVERDGALLAGVVELTLVSRPQATALQGPYERARASSRALLQQGIRVLGGQPVELEAWFVDYPLGDVTQSGSVGLLDALRILDIAVGADVGPSAFARYTADLDSSGLVNVVDVLIALEKVVDPLRPARLEVAPRVLHLDATSNGIVLIGNSGNVPLPSVTLTPPDGVVLTEVSGEGAVGRAFRAWALADVVEPLLVDAGAAGTSEIVAAVAGYIEIVATDSLMLTGVGASTQLSALVYQADGTVVADAQVEWSSSDPGAVAVDAAGLLTAQVEAGTAAISARAGALSSSVFAGVVELSGESRLVDKFEVLSIEPDGSDRSWVTLSKVRAYVVGDIVVSEAGLLSRILSLTDEGTHYRALVESVELSEAFEQISISGVSAPISYAASVTSQGVLVTSSDARIAPLGKFNLGALECETESGASVEWDLQVGSIDISYRPTIHFEYEHRRAGNVQVLRMYLSDRPTLYMAPSVLTVEAAVEGKIVCSRQIAPKLNIAIATLWGIVTVNGSFTPKIGFQAEARAWGELTIVTPSVTAGIDIRAVGVQYDAKAGRWSILSDTQPFFELGELSTKVDTKFTASVGPFLSLGAGVSIRVLVDAVGIDFLEPNIYGKLDIVLEDPLLFPQRGYTGPRWDAEIGSVAKVKVEVTGIAAKVLKFFGVRTSFADDEYQLFRYPIDASPTLAVTTFAAGNSVFFTATVAPTRLSYVGRRVEFWAFRNGANTAVKVGEATLDASRVASATWFASGADHASYEIVALLFDRVFGTIFLPYPSNLATFALPGADTGAQSIVPQASTCGGVTVGANCSVTVRLLDNEDALLGMQFDIATPGFSMTSASLTGLTTGCEIDASPQYGRVAIVCRANVTNSGDIAQIQLSRTSAGLSSFATSRAFVTNSSLLERPVSGGVLDVP